MIDRFLITLTCKALCLLETLQLRSARWYEDNAMHWRDMAKDWRDHDQDLDARLAFSRAEHSSILAEKMRERARLVRQSIDEAYDVKRRIELAR